MAEEQDSRRFSGGIATGADAAGPVIDAEFVAVGAATPSPAPPRPMVNAPARGPARGMDMLSRPGRAGSQRGGPMFWSMGAIVIASAFWVSGGHVLFARAAPAVQVEAKLAIRDLSVRVEERNGRSLILVDGRVANPGAARQPVPPIAIEIVGKDGRRVRHLLSTNGEYVAPSADFAFSSRLQAPMGVVDKVDVKLAE